MRHLKIINTFVGTLLLLTLSINCLTASKYSRKYSPKLFVEDTVVQLETLMEISLIGPDAAIAKDDLIKLFMKERNAEVRRMVLEALGAIKADLGSREVNYTFILGMNDEDIYVRYAAIAIIEELNVVPVNFIPYLQRRLADSDPLVRDVAMRTFQRLERLGVRTLIGALKYPDMRVCAAITLGRLGKADRLNKNDCCYAIKELEKIQGSDGENEELKEAVAQAIKDISEESIHEEYVSEEKIPELKIPEEKTPEEDIIKEIIPKEVLSKEDSPMKDSPKEEIPKEDIPKVDIFKEDIPKEENSKEDLSEKDIPYWKRR